MKQTRYILLISNRISKDIELLAFQPFNNRTIGEIIEEAKDRAMGGLEAPGIGKSEESKKAMREDVNVVQLFPYYFGKSEAHFSKRSRAMLQKQTMISIIDCASFDYDAHGKHALDACIMLGLFGENPDRKYRYVINSDDHKEYEYLIPPKKLYISEDADIITIVGREFLEEDERQIADSVK